MDSQANRWVAGDTEHPVRFTWLIDLRDFFSLEHRRG